MPANPLDLERDSCRGKGKLDHVPLGQTLVRTFQGIFRFRRMIASCMTTVKPLLWEHILPKSTSHVQCSEEERQRVLWMEYYVKRREHIEVSC